MISLGNSYRRYALTVDKINEYAKTSPEQFVHEAEKAYRADIKETAKKIINSPEKCRVVMFAGPSASGKTTTAKMIGEELEKLGTMAEIVSMDNFYLGEARVPRTRDDRPDFECVEALDIPTIERCIGELLKTGETDIPTFNFAKSEPNPDTVHVSLKGGKIAIIEGIHALNPIFTEHLRSTGGLQKIYISVKQGIHKEKIKGYFVTACELRLMRRLVRDCKFRGSNAEHTLGMWDNVLHGEKKYIVPYKYSGDITINSIHIYEPCLTAPMAADILSRVTPEHKDYAYARDLLERISQFNSIDPSIVPNDSLLREFIGKGKYKY